MPRPPVVLSAGNRISVFVVPGGRFSAVGQEIISSPWPVSWLPVLPWRPPLLWPAAFAAAFAGAFAGAFAFAFAGFGRRFRRRLCRSLRGGLGFRRGLCRGLRPVLLAGLRRGLRRILLRMLPYALPPFQICDSASPGPGLTVPSCVRNRSIHQGGFPSFLL